MSENWEAAEYQKALADLAALRAANAELREALERLVYEFQSADLGSEAEHAIRDARAALAKAAP